MEAIGDALIVEPYCATVGLARSSCPRPAARRAAQRSAAVAGGRLKLAFAHAERGARYDLAQVARARARRRGFVIAAPSAWCPRRVRRSARVSAHAGAATDRDGVEPLPRRPRRPGSHASALSHARRHARRGHPLDGRARAADALLGTRAWRSPLIERVVDFATALVCAEAVGAIRYANDATLDTSRRASSSACRSAAFQALQHRMVDLAIDYEQARSMASLACAAVDAESDAARAQRIGVRGQGAHRRRVPAREPGIGAAARRHGL
jgi:alkylation response protein AidB-like acyl-CoA dehydrogenase